MHKGDTDPIDTRKHHRKSKKRPYIDREKAKTKHVKQEHKNIKRRTKHFHETDLLFFISNQRKIDVRFVCIGLSVCLCANNARFYPGWEFQAEWMNFSVSAELLLKSLLSLMNT